jgi:hypothetical protein
MSSLQVRFHSLASPLLEELKRYILMLLEFVVEYIILPVKHVVPTIHSYVQSFMSYVYWGSLTVLLLWYGPVILSFLLEVYRRHHKPTSKE